MPGMHSATWPVFERIRFQPSWYGLPATATRYWAGLIPPYSSSHASFKETAWVVYEMSNETYECHLDVDGGWATLVRVALWRTTDGVDVEDRRPSVHVRVAA